MMRIVALSGSQSRPSISRALVTAALRCQPPDMEIVVPDLEAIPFFDEELELRGDPLMVRSLKRTVANADGLLIATGEHNGSVPAVLKNAIDWISRPYLSSPLSRKPCGVMAGSYSGEIAHGALRHLREILIKADADPLSRELGIGRVHQRIAANGDVLDSDTRDRIKALLADLAQAAGSDCASRSTMRLCRRRAEALAPTGGA